MPTQKAIDAIPSVERQDELDEPIKVKWDRESKSRSRYAERFAGALVGDAHGNRGDDGQEPKFRGVMFRAFTRQRTQVVFQTEQEAVEFLKFSQTDIDHTNLHSVTPIMAKTYRRVRREVRAGLSEQGVDPEEVTGV